VIAPTLLLTLSAGALSASLALLMAHLRFPVAADILAVGGAVLGAAAFVAVASSTVRSARCLPSPRDRR
jgi:hypothetical protein